jgi:hypothetical protein
MLLLHSKPIGKQFKRKTVLQLCLSQALIEAAHYVLSEIDQSSRQDTRIQTRYYFATQAALPPHSVSAPSGSVSSHVP